MPGIPLEIAANGGVLFHWMPDQVRNDDAITPPPHVIPANAGIHLEIAAHGGGFIRRIKKGQHYRPFTIILNIGLSAPPSSKA